MASSYSTNFKIEKMATGDQSGTWGTTTNHNFDILDRIAAFKAVALSDAATATLTVAAGSPSSGSSNVQDGMFRVIKFTGSLSQACTITIAPSTTTAYFIIENGTSGSQNIIMAQGSAAQTVTIAPAKSDIIYCDGSDEVISVGTKIGLSIALDDIATGDAASTLATSAGNITVDAQGNDTDIIFKGTDNTADITMLTLDGSDAGTATFNHDVKLGTDSSVLGFGADNDTTLTHTDGTGLTLNGTNKLTFNDTGTYVHSNADGDLDLVADGTAVDSINIESAGGITLDAGTAASGIIYEDDGTEMARLHNSSSDVILETKVSDKDLLIKGNDGGSTVTPATFDMSAKGKLLMGAGAVGSTQTAGSQTGSVTLDFDTYSNFVLTATGNVTLANPTTESVGQSGIIVFIQDGTGSRTLSLGTDYETAGGAGLTISTAANAVDVIPYFVKAADSIQLGAPQLAFA
jgi:hypothetical protein